LSSANAAAVALIFVTTLTLARSAIVDGPTLAIAAAALGLGLLLDINPAFLIAASGIIGWLVYR
jgi:chromate transport protein ChrA